MPLQILSRIFGYIVQCTTLLFLILPVSFTFILMQIMLLHQKIKLRFVSPTSARLSPFKGGRMYELDALSTEEKLDFKRYRSSSYIYELTYGCMWEFSKFLGFQQKVPLIADNVMRDVILNSTCCHGLIRGDSDSDIEWRLPFSREKYTLFNGFYWDVKEIRLHKNKSVSIEDRSGEIHTPDSDTWVLAKAHAQCQLTFFAPGLAHNHVHFVFPTLMASQARSVLPKTSVLRQLIEPHTRFTQYINFKALNECQSSSNTRSLGDKVLRPWLSFPISNNDFLTGIQENCEKFYYEDMTLTQKMEDDLPYHAFLKSYYKLVEKFVKRLEPLLTKDYEALMSSVKEYLPAIEQQSLIDVISTLVWNCGVVHHCDHYTYLQQYAMKYGCMAIRRPLIPPSKSCSLKMDELKSLSPNNENEASDLFHTCDIYRTRCFLRSFVRYNPNSSLDMTLPATRYNFSDESAQKSSVEFLRELEILDIDLSETKKAIVPLSSIVRTVCF